MERRDELHELVVSGASELEAEIAKLEGKIEKDFKAKGCSEEDLPFRIDDLKSKCKGVVAKFTQLADKAESVKKQDFQSCEKEALALHVLIAPAKTQIADQMSSMAYCVEKKRSVARKVYQKDRWSKVKFLQAAVAAGFEEKPSQFLSAWHMKCAAAPESSHEFKAVLPELVGEECSIVLGPCVTKFSHSKPAVWLPDSPALKRLQEQIDAHSASIDGKIQTLQAQLRTKTRWPSCQGVVASEWALKSGFGLFAETELGPEEGAHPWMVVLRTGKKLSAKRLTLPWFPHLVISYDDHLMVHLVHAQAALSEGIQLENMESCAHADWLDANSIAMWLPSKHILYVPMGWHPCVARMKVDDIMDPNKAAKTEEDFGKFMCVPVWDRAAWLTVEAPIRGALFKHHETTFAEKKCNQMWDQRFDVLKKFQEALVDGVPE